MSGPGQTASSSIRPGAVYSEKRGRETEPTNSLPPGSGSMSPTNSESKLASWGYGSATIAPWVAGSSLSTRPREGHSPRACPRL